MTDQPIEPMTDEVIAWWRERVTTNLWDRDVLSLMARLDAEIAARKAAEARYQEQHDIVARIWRQFDSPNYADLAGRSIHDLIDALKAERDAALARALPAPVKMETVEQVQALPVGLYREREPSNRGRSIVWAKIEPDVWWLYGDDEANGDDEDMVGSTMLGPLPDIPIPTSEEPVRGQPSRQPERLDATLERFPWLKGDDATATSRRAERCNYHMSRFRFGRRFSSSLRLSPSSRSAAASSA